MKEKTAEEEQCILVVDDDEVVRNFLQSALTQAGYQVLTAVDGVDALRVARSISTIHLILTDIRMPHMNGIDLTKIMRVERPDVKVLLMTGYTEAEIASQELDLILMRKPFVPQKLFDAIRDLLENPRPREMLI